MKIRHLGSNGPTTSAIGLGCMGFSQGYGPTDDAASASAIRHARDAGVSLFDTAMSYGQGHNERLVGAALHGDDEALVATKFGIMRDETGVRLDARPEHVRGFCEQSLQRLGRDRIDVYYLHRVDPQVPIGETVAAMAELVDAGLVRHLGLSEVTAEQLEAAVAVHPIAAVEFEWSMLWRGPEDDVVPAARRHGVALVPYSPLGRGLLTATLSADTVASSDFRRGDPRFTDANLDANLELVSTLARLATAHQVTAGQLALAWLLHQGDDVVPIPGSRHAARVVENAAAADVVLSAEDLAQIDAALPRAAWAGDRTSFAVATTTRR